MKMPADKLKHDLRWPLTSDDDGSVSMSSAESLCQYQQ